jgi:dihydropyrimidine dehydrogenase (NAD+) subunit PreA
VNVCPVDGCLTLRTLPEGAIDPRTGDKVGGYGDWTTHPNNPNRSAA